MTRTTRLLATVLAAAALATACSAGSSGDATSSVAAVGGAETAPSSEGDARAGAATDEPARRVLTAGVVVAVDDLADAAQQVRAVAARAQGSISSEDVDLASSSRGRAVLVLRVPPAPLDDTIAAVAAVGTEVSRTRTAEDVEATLTDVASRISSQTASVDRVRALMGSATSLTDVVALEDALTSRTADLEALQAQQADVQGRVDLATLTVELRRTAVVAAAEPDRTGFVGGLQGGWDALTSAVGVALTVLGALLPFLLVAVVLGAPVAWVLRRRARVAVVPTSE